MSTRSPIVKNGRTPTLRDVADLAGLDVATVSRALNSRGYMSVRTREAALSAARQIGYQRNELARAVATGQSRMVGFLLSGEITSQRGGNGVGPLLGAIDEAARQGYTVKVFGVSDVAGAAAAVASSSELRLPGLLTIQPDTPITIEMLRLLRLNNPHTPLVLIDSTSDLATRYDRVNCDSSAGVRQMVRYLAGLGHRRICCFSGPLNFSSFQRREEGFRAAMRENGLPFSEHDIVDGGIPFNCDTAMKVVSGLLGDYTAILCLSDARAMLILQAAYELNIRVPEALSVTSITDWNFEASASPPLTTIALPYIDMGREAFRLLLRRIEDRRSGEAPHEEDTEEVMLPTQFVLRASAAAPGR